MAVFNYFNSVISRNLKRLKRDVKRYSKALNIASSQNFEIQAVIHDDTHATFTAKVNSERNSESYYTTLIVRNDELKCYCTCKDCSEKNTFCKHSIALAIVVKQFKAQDFSKFYDKLYAKVNNNEMFITYYDTIYDIENKITLKVLSDFMDRISHYIPEEIWGDVNYEYVSFVDELTQEPKISIPEKSFTTGGVSYEKNTLHS